jgi:hypothetical protein
MHRVFTRVLNNFSATELEGFCQCGATFDPRQQHIERLRHLFSRSRSLGHLLFGLTGLLRKPALISVCETMGLPLNMSSATASDTETCTDMPYPAQTKHAATRIDGILTEVLAIFFSDRIMISITQEGRLAQWVSEYGCKSVFRADGKSG